MTTPAVLEKRLYTAPASATSGRDGRIKSDDATLDMAVSPPKALGGSAAQHVARAQKLQTGPIKITANVTLGPVGQAYGLAVELVASIPELEREKAQALIEAAHQVCPYSNATRGNIVVDLRLE